MQQKIILIGDTKKSHFDEGQLEDVVTREGVGKSKILEVFSWTYVKDRGISSAKAGPGSTDWTYGDKDFKVLSQEVKVTVYDPPKIMKDDVKKWWYNGVDAVGIVLDGGKEPGTSDYGKAMGAFQGHLRKFKELKDAAIKLEKTPPVVFILVNKTDLWRDKTVSEGAWKEAIQATLEQELGKEEANKVLVSFCSAEKSTNIVETFEKVAGLIVNNQPSLSAEKSTNIVETFEKVAGLIVNNQPSLFSKVVEFCSDHKLAISNGILLLLTVGLVLTSLFFPPAAAALAFGATWAGAAPTMSLLFGVAAAAVWNAGYYVASLLGEGPIEPPTEKAGQGEQPEKDTPYDVLPKSGTQTQSVAYGQASDNNSPAIPADKLLEPALPLGVRNEGLDSKDLEGPAGTAGNNSTLAGRYIEGSTGGTQAGSETDASTDSTSDTQQKQITL